jgi:signal transduction histidine kinase
MAISFRIVQEHGGRIDVQSREGNGTTIILHLPR